MLDVHALTKPILAHAATHERPSPMSLIRALAGRELKDKRSYMTVRERTDFFLLIVLFGVLVGV